MVRPSLAKELWGRRWATYALPDTSRSSRTIMAGPLRAGKPDMAPLKSARLHFPRGPSGFGHYWSAPAGLRGESPG